MGCDQQFTWFQGRKGLTTIEYFEAGDRVWTVDGNGKAKGMMFYRQWKPGAHLMGVSVGIYNPDTGDVVQGPVGLSSFSVFMMENRLAQKALEDRTDPTQGYDGRTYAAVIAETEGRSFRGGMEESYSGKREAYFSNFGKGWPIGRGRRSVNNMAGSPGEGIPPYLFVQYEYLEASNLICKATMEVWRPAEDA